MDICVFGHQIKVALDTIIALSALLLSIISLGLSVYFWRRSFRPIVTAMVKTHNAGNELIGYDLEVLNSGTLPAKNIRLRTNQDAISNVLGNDADDGNRRRWLCCFEPETIIKILHNNERIRCSFGTTVANDNGFWKYNSIIPIIIEYEGWFGKKYTQSQDIQIIDSDSFTGFMWG